MIIWEYYIIKFCLTNVRTWTHWRYSFALNTIIEHVYWKIHNIKKEEGELPYIHEEVFKAQDISVGNEKIEKNGIREDVDGWRL